MGIVWVPQFRRIALRLVVLRSTPVRAGQRFPEPLAPLPFNKRVRVWACKIRKPHTHVFVPTSHKVFLRNYWNPKEPATNICHSQIIPIFFYLSLITKRKNAYINLKSMLYCYRQLNMVRIGNAQSSGMITNNT